MFNPVMIYNFLHSTTLLRDAVHDVPGALRSRLDANEESIAEYLRSR